MEILVNGKATEVAAETTVARLLDMLKLSNVRVAVQMNADIIKRERYDSASLCPGDRIEILTFTAGG